MPDDNFTFEKLLEAWDILRPPLYYATVDNCEPDKIYHITARKGRPEYIVFHPSNFEKLEREITTRRLVHLSDYPLENILADILKTLKCQK